MKNKGLVLLGVIMGILLTFSFLWNGTHSLVQAEVNREQSTYTPLPTEPILDESANAVSQGAENFSDEVLPEGYSADSLTIAYDLPAPIPGETLVYFVPTDSEDTATVLYLYNTDTVAHTVALRGFSYNGSLSYSQDISIGATSFLRLISDPLAAAPPPSWITPAPINTNFSDFTYFGSLSLPKGVKVEGYTLFNPGTGVVNPRMDQGAIPLRFSTDPNTVFLPSVQK